MNNRTLIQCKRAIITNKSVDGKVKLSLFEKQKLRNLTKELRSNNIMDNLSFEEFVLLYKLFGLNVLLNIKSEYRTKIINLLHFSDEALKVTLLKSIEDILLNEDSNKFPNIDLVKVYDNINNRNNILFEEFELWCEKLNIIIKID